MRYFFEISFDGTNYHGWQSQKNSVSIQEVIESSISTILNKTVKITGAGRTDTGVHAKQMYFHLDSDEIKDIPLTQFNLNNYLPKDISILSINKVCKNAHARFDAISREYEYVIINKKDCFLNNKAYLIQQKIDVQKMNLAANFLLKTRNFTSFCKMHSNVKTHICKVVKSEWVFVKEKLIYRIVADRFLRNMVRAIVGTLLEVGLGKLSVNKFKEIVNSENRSLAGMSAPAQGLYLKKILYPKNIFNG